MAQDNIELLNNVKDTITNAMNVISEQMAAISDIDPDSPCRKENCEMADAWDKVCEDYHKEPAEQCQAAILTRFGERYHIENVFDKFNEYDELRKQWNYVLALDFVTPRNAEFVLENL